MRPWTQAGRIALALAAGVALWLAFPEPGLWPLAFVGVALLSLATRGASAGLGVLLGFLCGLTFFLPLLHWTGIYVGDVPWVALSVFQALYVALVGWGSALLQQSPSLGGTDRARPVAVALLWVAAEALRAAVPFGGFPWGRLAFSQADSPLARLAALAGAPAVTFGVALVGGVLAAAVSRSWRPSVSTTRNTADRMAKPPSSRADRLRRVLPGVAVAAAVLFAPLLVDLPTDGATAQLLAVQGNVPRPGLDFNAERRAVLDNHAQQTASAAARVRDGAMPQPDLVVWPENSSDIDPLRNPDAERVITGAVRAIGAPVLVGAVLREPEPLLSNVTLLYTPGTVGPQQRYVKQHPVPFAEYIPWRPFFRAFSDKVDLLERDFAAGQGTGVFPVPTADGRTIAAGTAICFEVAYDHLVRNVVTAGANLLVVQTNNATFGFTDESVEQLAISRLRAIEHGRSVVHASTVGVSALIRPDGTLQEQSALFTAAALAGALPLRTAITPADRVGAWPELLACAAALLLLLSALVGRYRGGGRRRPDGGGYRRQGSSTKDTDGRLSSQAGGR